MNVLITVNDAPYGSEQVYNALRLAGSLDKQKGTMARLFLVGAAVLCARSGQKAPRGYYNVHTPWG